MVITKKVNVSLDQDLHKKAKLIAILKQLTLNDFIKHSIEEQVKKEKELLKRMFK